MSRNVSGFYLAVLALGSFALLSSCGPTQRADGGSGLLPAGQVAPALVAEDHRGKEVNLERLTREGSVLIYFYPKDSTPGCTKEACALRDTWKRFSTARVTVIGVSKDSAKKHRQFAEKHRLPFSLIADASGQWGEAFGVSKTLGFYSRVSFLLGPGRRIQRVYKDVDPALHASEVLEDVKRLRK